MAASPAEEEAQEIDGAGGDAGTIDEAAEVEAAGYKTITVSYAGEDWTIPASLDDADVDVIEAFEEEKVVGILRGLLGPAQWKMLKRAARRDRHPQPFRAEELTPLVEQIAKIYGFDTAGG